MSDAAEEMSEPARSALAREVRRDRRPTRVVRSVVEFHGNVSEKAGKLAVRQRARWVVFFRQLSGTNGKKLTFGWHRLHNVQSNAWTRTMVFPPIANDHEFAQWRSNPENWTPLVRSMAHAEAVHAPRPTAFGTGTNLVVDLDGRAILKLFPPIYRAQFHSERATLRQLAGRLAVPIPSLVAECEHDGWSWLIMSKLDGIVGSEAWPKLTEREKERILRQIGSTIAEVQAVPLGEIADIKPSWPVFLAKQVEGCVERHRRQGLALRFLADLPSLLADVPSIVPYNPPPVILTGEWIPENFLLAETDEGWTLAAVIDFGDVMAGWREYDLLGPSAFMCGGKPGRVRSLFEGYGMTAGDCSDVMRRRLLTLMLLHRASDLRNVRIDEWEGKIESLLDLADVIWNVSER